VLEPFCGLGGVGEVAVRLGRNYLGVEHNEEIAARARARLGAVEREEGRR
jgi:DNA modification methylase